MRQATVRRAVAGDAGALAALGARTFVESFGHLYAPHDLAAFLTGEHAPGAYARALADPGQALWLAEANGAPVAYAQAGPCRLPHADVREGDGEIKRLYVAAGAQGDGLGTRLMDAVMAWLLADGPKALWVSVWSENIGAQRFYARYGFAIAGEYDFIVGAQRDREFIYRRPPAAQAPQATAV